MDKKAIIIGGTGFLGYHASFELARRGWSVTALGLPTDDVAGMFPPHIHVLLRNVHQLTDDELSGLLSGHTALVFASGMDDRATPDKPAYPKFHAANVDTTQRLLELAQRVGIERSVVLGSYFCHFAREWPHLRIRARHPYIRSRLEQESVSQAAGAIVLELPYIFGSAPNRKPLWAPLVSYLRSTRFVLYTHGGTNCVSAKTVGEAIAGAVEQGTAGERYLVGGENLQWREMLTRLARADGRTIEVIPLPDWLIAAALLGVKTRQFIVGKEAGLDLRHLVALQTAKTFFDVHIAADQLGYIPAGLDEAFQETVDACPRRTIRRRAALSDG
jgi:nucleoside-diphosphate-sugar epimerase